MPAPGSVCCPVCGVAVHSPPEAVYSADQAAAHFCPPWRSKDRYDRLRDVVADIWESDVSAVYFCPACKFGFGWPHKGGNEAYYDILHEQAGYPAHRWEYGWTLREVIPSHRAGGALLDIGTGDGSFLRLAPDDWRKAATEGSETNRAMLRGKGIDCFPSVCARHNHS